MAVEKKTEAVKVVKKDKSYYFKNIKTVSMSVAIVAGDQTVMQKIDGNNHIAVIRGTDPFYKDKVAFMNTHKWGAKSGGSEFVELKNGVMPDDGSCLLDELLPIENEGLVSMLKKKDGSTMQMSRGNLLIKVLKEKGAI